MNDEAVYISDDESIEIFDRNDSSRRGRRFSGSGGDNTEALQEVVKLFVVKLSENLNCYYPNVVTSCKPDQVEITYFPTRRIFVVESPVQLTIRGSSESCKFCSVETTYKALCPVGHALCVGCYTLRTSLGKHLKDEANTLSLATKSLFLAPYVSKRLARVAISEFYWRSEQLLCILSKCPTCKNNNKEFDAGESVDRRELWRSMSNYISSFSSCSATQYKNLLTVALSPHNKLHMFDGFAHSA